MRIEVLGPVRLSAEPGAPVEVAERHLRLLLAALVAANGEPVSTDALIDRLWGESLPANPKKVLRAKLSRLRAVLDKAQPGAREFLTHAGGGYRLTVPSDVVDAGRFQHAIERARGATDGQRKIDGLTEALELWRGEPYGDIADEIWLAPAVAQLRKLRGDALEILVESLVQQGAPEKALSYADGLVAEHATREGLITALMLALYQVGRQHEALAMYESLRHRLAEDLGIDPSPHIRELHGQILRQDPALTRTPGPKPDTAVHARRTNLPAETTPLIGREREGEQVTALLAESRLVTLTGIGGVGKTRLALRLAHDQAAHFTRGAWFIELTELTTTTGDQLGSGERIAALAVTTMELSDQLSTAGSMGRLRQALGAHSTLLVLDNCEHVAAEAAVFVAELLRQVPSARVLATSREPLGLPEEQRFDVGALSTESTASGETSAAVELFIARAKASDPDVALDAHTTAAIAELCRRLDGLPLALELAAGRIRGLSVHDLLARLSDRLNLLRRPGRGVPRRQQTLRGMIDWSWSLLEEAEQTVLRRLAIHPGTLSLAAAEVICADDTYDTDQPVVRPSDVADVLIGLVDRSMVNTVHTPAGVRYGLLESISTYAEEKLDEAGERAAFAQRHLHYYLDLAREADEHIRGPAQRHWLTRLESERNQLRHAFDTAVSAKDGHSAVAMAVRTFWYQWIAGHHANLHRDVNTATTLPGPRDDTYAAAATLAACMNLHRRPGREADLVAEALALFRDDRARARMQWFAGTSLLGIGIRDAGEKHVDESIAILQALGHEWDVAVAASQRDWFLVSNWGVAPRGQPDGRDPETVLRALGDGYGLSQVFGVEYQVAELRGDHRRAADAATRALDICFDLDLRVEASYWFSAAAIAAVRSGDLPLAHERVAQARSLASDVADQNGLLFADFAEANIARCTGDPATARALLDRWLSYHGRLAERDSSAQFERGFLAIQEGDLNQAEDALRHLTARPARDPESPATARMLELTAAVRAARPDAEDLRAAAELLGAADALRARIGAEPSMPERGDIDRIRARVGERLPGGVAH
ncbi:putative ATPase [Tamaricihabitans halophyticus]|uniref:Putative ATPase n=1 Tax=Tamaricihabitans halophyticus TaxID=1262583 RepID=A0A4R2R014_9PSEU|nr:BTAD domain-containing putative transcriptional regulator [Tamaricihabitans halophyticus]TCP55004.1 putative ATPase [Tamaricihabitans halophyticus]